MKNLIVDITKIIYNNSFWLSKWTSDAYNNTSSSDKFLDVGVYSALGIIQCIYFSKFTLKFS